MGVELAKAFVTIRGDNTRLAGDLNASRSKLRDSMSRFVTDSTRLTAAGFSKFRFAAVRAAQAAAVAIIPVTRAWGAAGIAISSAASRIALGVAAIGTVSIVRFAQLERTMTRVGSVTGTLATRDFGTLQAAALKMGATTEFTANQAAGAMEQLGLAGFKTREIIAALPGTLQLATAAQIDIATASSIAAKTMRAFALDASQLGRINDTLVATFTRSNTDLRQLAEALKPVGPIAKTMGVSLEDTTAVLAKMADAGFSGGLGGTSLRNALIRMAKPLSDSKKLLKAFGVEGADPLFVKLRKIEVGLKSAANETAQLNIATTLFGVRGGPAMLAAMDGGVDAIEKFSQGLKDAGGLAQEIQEAQLKTLGGQFNLLKSAVDGVVISIGAKLAPKIRGLIQNFKKFTEVNMDKIATSVANAVMGLADGVGNAFSAFVELLPSIKNAAEQLKKFFKPLFEFIGKHPQILVAFAALKVTGFLGLNSAVVLVAHAIRVTLVSAFGIASPFLLAFASSMGLVTISTTTGSVALTAFGVKLAIATAGISLIVAGLILFFTQTETGKNIIRGLIDVMQPLIDVAREVFETISKELKPAFEELGSLLRDVVVDVFEELKPIIKEVALAVADLWDILKPFVKKHFEDMAAGIRVAAKAFALMAQSARDAARGLREVQKLVPGLGGGGNIGKIQPGRRAGPRIRARIAGGEKFDEAQIIPKLPGDLIPPEVIEDTGKKFGMAAAEPLIEAGRSTFRGIGRKIQDALLERDKKNLDKQQVDIGNKQLAKTDKLIEAVKAISPAAQLGLT